MRNKFKILLAVIILTSSFSVFSQLIYSYLELGRQELIKNNYPKAISYLNYSIQTRPDHYEAYFFRGLAKYYLDDLFGAEKDYDKAIEMFPPDKRFYIFRAMVRDKQFNVDGAFEDYNTALSIDSGYAMVYFNRSLTYLRLHDYENSLKDANRAINLKVNEVNIFLIRGAAHSGLEKYEDAIFDFNKVLANNPFHSSAYIYRAIALMGLSRIDSAITDLNFVIDMDSTNSLAIYYRALCKMKLDEIDNALEDLDKVTEISPYNSLAYYYKGIMYNQKEEGSKQALLNFDKALSLDPDNILIYYARGLNKYQSEDYSGAIEDMNNLLEIYPDFADAYSLRSAIKSKLNDYFGSKEDNEKALEINERNNIKDEDQKYAEGIELMKLTDFTGDFITMSEKRKLVQFQEKDIELIPFYKLTLIPDNKKDVFVYKPTQISKYSFQILTLISGNESSSIQEKTELLNEIDSLQEKTNSKELLIKRAIINYSLDNYLQSLTTFNHLISNNDNEVVSRFTRANIMLELLEMVQSNDENYQQIITSFFEEYSQQEDFIDISYNNVIKDFTKVVEMDPNFYFAYYNRAYVKYLTKDFNGAIDDFWNVLKQNENFTEAYYNRGLILIFIGEKTMGCEDIRKAGELGISDSYNVLKRFCAQ
ncbi:tetratricopeptide repeat protein [Bacteroidota bacterium]